MVSFHSVILCQFLPRSCLASCISHAVLTAKLSLSLMLVKNGPAHKLLVLIAYVQKPSFNALADIYSGPGGLNFDLSLHLNL